MKINRLAALLSAAVTAAIALGGSAVVTSAAHTRSTARQHVIATAPTSCATTATAPAVVVRCGDCTRITFIDAATRSQAIDDIVSAAPGNVWLVVGNRWIAGDDATTLQGAANCSQRFGGWIRFFGAS